MDFAGWEVWVGGSSIEGSVTSGIAGKQENIWESLAELKRRQFGMQ